MDATLDSQILSALREYGDFAPLWLIGLWIERTTPGHVVRAFGHIVWYRPNHPADVELAAALCRLADTGRLARRWSESPRREWTYCLAVGT